MTGIKYDSEKPKMHLVPPRALIEVARGMTLGAKKYAAYNWSSGIEWSRLLSAAFRHLTAFNSGEDIDPDSGLPHLAHAGCCVLMLLEMTMSRPDLDDRDPHLKAAHAKKLALLLSAVASGKADINDTMGGFTPIYCVCSDKTGPVADNDGETCVRCGGKIA